MDQEQGREKHDEKLKTPHSVPQTVRSPQALGSATALAESRIAREEEEEKLKDFSFFL